MELKREIDNDGANGRFFHSEGEERFSVLEFLLTNTKRLVIKHTEVAADLAGKGYGKALVQAASQWSRENGYKILPVCPYAKNIMVNNREDFADVLV